MYYDNSEPIVVLGENEIVDGEYPTAEFQKVNSVCVEGGGRFGVSAVNFDPFEELIWAGNQGGHVNSYYSSSMEKYVSFQAHPNEEIRQIIPLNELILFLSQTQLRGQIRRGLPTFTFSSPSLAEMQCMIVTSPVTVLMGGHQNEVVEFDLSNSCELRSIKLPYESTCAILRSTQSIHNNVILSGDPNGQIHFLDDRTLGVEHTIEAHSGSLSDFDVHGNLMVTCGFSNRQGNMSLDRFIKVYDIRTFRAMAPIQISIDPLLLRFSTFPASRIAAVSSNGQMEILETQAVSQANICIYQVTSSPSAGISSFDVSSLCHHMVFGDSSGYLNLFSSSDSSFFNAYSRDTEFPDAPPESINLENSSLALIPLYYNNQDHNPLLSDWPEELTERVYRKTPQINSSILNSVKQVGTIGYAANPHLFLRNQVMYKMHEYKQVNKNKSSQKKLTYKIPKRYVKSNYVNEENRELQNKYCGLDGNLVNSYCNSVIQVLSHIEFLNASLINHYCSKESCLTCELGFLFKNMSSNISVSGVGNFLRVFRMVPEASALGLILHENLKNKTCLLRIIQNWNRFILHQVQGELGKHGDPISKLFAMKQENMNRCTKCGREEAKQSTVLLSNILYSPDCGKRVRFAELLQRSLCPSNTTPAWCDLCEKYQPTFQSRVPKALPPIISLNTCLDNAHDFQVWKSSLESMLNSEVAVSPVVKTCRYGKGCNRVDCKFRHEDRQDVEGEAIAPPTSAEFEQNPEVQVNWLPSDLKIVLEEASVRVVENSESPDYELFAVVVFVKDENEEKCNLVSLIQLNGEWNVFNDFMIRPVKPTEATHFNPKWKIPAIVFYRKKTLPNPPKLIKHKISFDVFKHNAKQKYKTLTRDEHLTLVAFDSEFVTLGQEETELRSDGKLATIKPQQLSVARVTVVRENGQALMDDYVHTQEVVVDYLTKFSGIQPGDLDANYSSKNVTSLKIVYSKLCYLIEQGVKFVGHGINNDFRVINLVVPSEQIIDTVTLFYIPNQRMVSLRFLAWHFLGMNIQTEVHDSLEDAKATLYLYRKYEELKKKGKLEKAIEELYEIGRKLNWTVP